MLPTKLILTFLCTWIIQTSAVPWKYGLNFPVSNEDISLKKHERIQMSRAFTSKDVFQSIGLILSEQLSENGGEIFKLILSQLRTLDVVKKNNLEDNTQTPDVKSLNIPKNRTARLVNFAIDLIVKLSQPFLGPRGFIFLVTIVRPILVAVGISMMNSGANLMKNFMNQEPILDSNLLKDPSYEVYPVFIPGYGSYILVSDAGSLGPPNMSNVEEMKTFESTTPSKNTTVTSIQTVNVTSPGLENNKTAPIVNTTIKDKNNTNTLNKNINNKTSSQINIPNSESLFLGQTHLIPIVDRPHIFESTKDLSEAVWSGETDAVLRDNIKEIVKTRMTIKSIKKRIILNILKRVEQTVLKM